MNPTTLYGAIALKNVRSCLVCRQDQLIVEHYRDHHSVSELAKINSCTKSILSSLICIAMDRGVLPAPSTPISVFFPGLNKDPDFRKENITLEHLLTMTPGWNWTEFGGQNSFPRMTRSPNWVDFVLKQSLSNSPGVRMEYNSGASQLLSAILMQASGMSTAHFAELYLFGPLGIEDYKWETDPQGIHTGGFGLWLRPSDLLKFGQLYLQEGIWDNQQLISSERVVRSVEPFILAEAPRHGGYGWHWWTDSYPRASHTEDNSSLAYYYARGYGGQFIYVLPELASIVVLTQDKYGKANPKVDIFREIIAPLLIGK